jgi:hypothetical protein
VVSTEQLGYLKGFSSPLLFFNFKMGVFSRCGVIGWSARHHAGDSRFSNYV